jgi:DNA-binding protein HU-beta
MTLGKKELVAHLVKTTDLTPDTTSKFIDEIFDWIRDSLKSGEDVRFIGFGSFAVQKIAARTGINPRTKEKMDFAASNRVSFKSGRELKSSINGGKTGQ